MKKVLSLVLVLTLVLGSFSFAFAAPSDVVGTDYEDAVERLSQLKVLTGYPDGTFKPNNTITRAEFAAAVVRVKGLESAALAAQGSTVFTDVPAGNWAAGYVNIASKLGIVKGMGDGTFAPNSPVTYEQAVTMVMRALNYEATAEARGGYPYGYLIVANENGLLDAVKGTQGLPAVRGLVAQLLDNALEIPMMIQVGVGFNSQPLWVKSGTQNTEEVNLLDDLGFTKVARERVVAFDKAKNEIRFEKFGKAKVAEGFDFEEVDGLRLNAWLDENNKVAVYTKVDTPKFDATMMSSAKILLIAENKSFVVNKNAKLYLNGTALDSDAAFVADYAKVVLNSEDEIVWAKGYTWDASYVVEEVKKDVVYSYGEELNVEKFTIVKEGKTIKAEDLEEGDILFFNEAKKYAEVYNDSITGEISKVYEDVFRIDGEDYDIAGTYLDGDSEVTLDHVALRAMQAEGEVTVFFARDGEVRFVVGDLGVETTSKVAVYLTENLVRDADVRGNLRYYLDGVNQNGTKVSEVLSQSIMRSTVTATTKAAYEATNGAGSWATAATTAKNAALDATLNSEFASSNTSAQAVAEKVVIVELDENGKIAKFAFPGANTSYTATGTDKGVALDAKYIASKKLSSTVVVFDATGTTVKAKTWGELKDIDYVTSADVYYNSNGYVTHLIIKATSNTEKEIKVSGVITDIRKVSGKNEWRVSAYVGNQEVEYVTAASVTSAPAVSAKQIKTLVLDENTGKLLRVENADLGATGAVTLVSTRTNEITVAGAVYQLVADGAVIDATGTTVKASSVRSLGVLLDTHNVTATVVLDVTSSNFAKLIVLTNKVEKTSGGGVVTGKAVQAINATSITVDGVQYPTTIDYTASISVGDNITFELVDGLYGQKTMINVQKVQ